MAQTDIRSKHHGMTPARPLLRLRQRRRGVSLVEVLVVLVILIVGISGMMRLFPEGFASLGFSANSTVATAMMQQNEDYLRHRSENLPDAIVGIDPTTGLIRSNITPNDLFTARPMPLAGTPDDPRFSHLNQVRRVLGEQLMLPPPTYAGSAAGEAASLYRLLFSPIYGSVATAPGGLGVSAYLATPMRRVVFNPDAFNYTNSSQWGELQRLAEFGYGIDYQQGLLYLQPAGYERQFKIDFRYQIGGSGGEGIPDNTLIVPGVGDLTQAITINLRDPASSGVTMTYPLPSAAVLEPGTDLLYRRFKMLPASTAFSADPFEFKVYDTLFGLIGFNPAAASLPLPGSQGRGLLVKVDYDVDDWHILRQEETVPLTPLDPDGSLVSGGSYSGDEVFVLKLMAGPIKRIGDMEDTINFDLTSGQNPPPDTYEYQGLVRYYPDSPGKPHTQRTATDPGIDVVIVDLETGLQIDSRTLQIGGNNSNGEIDYEAGVIRLKANALQWSRPPVTNPSGAASLAPAGRHVRIYYRTYNDFAVAPFKPDVRYYPVLPGAAQLTERRYALQPGGYLLFPAMDAERSVTVDYSYLLNVGGTRQVAMGELQKLSPPDPQLGAPPAAAANGYWWLRLAHSEADSAVTPNSVWVHAVRGASLHTHVVWKDGSRFRHRQRSTVLTRDSGD